MFGYRLLKLVGFRMFIIPAKLKIIPKTIRKNQYFYEIKDLQECLYLKNYQ